MKALKVLGFLLIGYVLIVVVFESLLGYVQPANDETLALTVNEVGGEPHQRVLSRIEHDDQLYVAVNHWPRAWYHTLEENPAVNVSFKDQVFPATAVIVTEPSELASVEAARPLGLGFRILTGFPPRHFVRLDPVLSQIESTTTDISELIPPVEQ